MSSAGKSSGLVSICRTRIRKRLQGLLLELDARQNYGFCLIQIKESRSQQFLLYNNHNLTPPHHVHYIRAHRKVSRVDLASALVMHRVGIEHFHIHKYMDLCFGGYTDVGYMRRDIKNVVVG